MANNKDNCGIGACRPKGMAFFGTINWFTGFYGVSGLLTASLSMYMLSQVTTIERQFNLSSTQSGFLMACNDIGYSVSIIIASYIASRVHIPRYLYASSMLYGVSGLLCALPHFMTNINTPKDSLGMPVALQFNRNLCTNESKVQTNYSMLSNITGSMQTGRDQNGSGSGLALTLIAIGMIMQGIGKAPRFPMISQYIDDNTKLRETGFYMGIIQCVTIFGPALAYGLGGFFSQIYVTLEDVDLHPMDPRWIGAWWLGFLSFGAATIVLSTPLLFFPKRILITKDKTKSEVTRRTRSACQTIGNEIKGFFKSVHSVVRSPLYVLIVIGAIINLLGLGATMAFGPKYIENQFNIPVWKSSIVIAAFGLPAVCLGVFLGGLLTKKVKLNPPRCLLYIVITQVLTIAFTFGLMFLRCEQPTITNWAPRLDSAALQPSSCSSSCSCDENVFLPVCGSDGSNYYSPCHAGCTNGTLQMFTNCTCISGGQAKTGLCEFDCHVFWTFNIVNFVASIISASSMMPTYIFTLRIVPNEVKSMGVGLCALAMSLFAWLPGPVIGGRLVDHACILWKMVGDSKGSCSMYQLDTLRYNMFGFVIGTKSVATLVMALALWMAWSMRTWPNEDFLEEQLAIKSEIRNDSEKPEADILLKKYRYSDKTLA